MFVSFVYALAIVPYTIDLGRNKSSVGWIEIILRIAQLTF